MALMKSPTPQQVAKYLVKIHEMPFGGKKRGRMKITRAGLRELSKRGRLENAFLSSLTTEMFQEGFMFIDLDKYFVVIQAKVTRRYRSISKNVMHQFLAQKSKRSTNASAV